MPEVARERRYFSLRRGLNSVSNEITFPDEYTSDELNYTIETDGSRKRRRGLAKESGGTTQTVVSIADGQANRSFRWPSAGGNPSNNLIVHQIGYTLYFTNDAETISTTYKNDTIDLSELVVDSSTTSATVGAEPCSFAVHRGYLVITHKYLTPFYLKYDGTNVNAGRIQILVRDFEGIDDGVATGASPDGTITADHYYNLLNRGWVPANITDYYTYSTGTVNPAKNMIPYLGYRRVADKSTPATTTYEADGTRQWDTVKMENEAFRSSSAPQGSLFIDPLNTTLAYADSSAIANTPLSYSGSDFAANPTSATTLTVPLTGHSYTSASPDIEITGQLWLYSTAYGYRWWSAMNNAPYGKGPWTCVDGAPTATGQVQVDSANELIFYVDPIPNWTAWYSTAQDGAISGEDPIPNSEGVALTVGPSACTTFAGRIWYAGIDDQEWADTIFFSQVALKPRSFGFCHQEADPTDEFNSQLRADDGGTIIIPNMGGVKQIHATRDAVIVFGGNGVWEITGTRRGGFAANNYQVRKITETGCVSSVSIVEVENLIAYASLQGMIGIAPNQYTGVLEETHLTDILEKTWNDITQANQAKIQSIYDDAKKRIYVLYRENATLTHTFDRALVYDLKNQGWYRLGFNYGAAAGIISMFAITDADNTNSNKKVKFQTQLTATTVDTCDMEQSDYLDFDDLESPLPYLVTGWDSSQGFQNRKQAPTVHVFNKRTSTGWTDAGDSWIENNVGSTLMTPFWDWTEPTQWDSPTSPTAQEPWDATASNYGISGKIGKQVETYRPVRRYTPLASTDVDGYPVVATRNKVRGRGRVLSMRFDGSATKDSHLLGFTTNYKVSRRK